MPGARFRWIDLIACVAVLCVALTAAVGARRSAQENSVIIGCSDRLRQLAQSLVLYQSLNDGRFPRTRFDPAAPLTAYTAADAPDPFAPDGPAVNDTTAAMFLLARQMELPPDAFVCPAALRIGLAEADDFDRTSVKRRSNFRARLNSNYTLANMYPDAAAKAAGYTLDRFLGRLPADFAVAADTGPGGTGPRSATTRASRLAMREANSPNHERDGQNVMFADGSVQFFNAPFVGVNYDNIYTGVGDTLRPASAVDSAMVPVWTEGPQRIARTTVNRRWVLGTVAVVTIGVVGWVVRRGVRRGRTGSRLAQDR